MTSQSTRASLEEAGGWSGKNAVSDLCELGGEYFLLKENNFSLPNLLSLIIVYYSETK